MQVIRPGKQQGTKNKAKAEVGGRAEEEEDEGLEEWRGKGMELKRERGGTRKEEEGKEWYTRCCQVIIASIRAARATAFESLLW